MSERGALAIPPDTLANQIRAADPNWSIWVSANAGSGKTFVLTRRVLRLLLAGVAPETILCLTYTKAAAAEMRRRVSDALGRWAILPEAELREDIGRLEGDNFPSALLDRARTLFARALDTPGGLKIVTIHAFCESVLHRFPLEAGVPFDFAVIEDDEREALLLAAREAVLAGGIGLSGPVETLLESLSDEQIRTAITEALGVGARLRPVLADAAAKARLETLVGYAGDTPDRLRARMEAECLLDPATCREIVTRFAGDATKTRGTRFVDLLARHEPFDLSAGVLRDLFMTNTGPRGTLLNATQAGQMPHWADLLKAEQERVVALDAQLATAELVERSHAVLDVVAAVRARYETDKRATSRLDFDDLVEKLADLFEAAPGAWVRYKLDAGIDHILVDESQDTNAEQWRVVTALTGEFFAGEGAVQRPRSLFAVGDQKQSIYSFQGAQPELFGLTGDMFQHRASLSGGNFDPLRLRTSFRTLAGILAAVNLVTDSDAMRLALLESAPEQHEAARTMPGGTVTLWPPTQQAAEAPASGQWPTTPLETAQTSQRQVAERIAGEIASWLRERRPLAGRGRAVTPDDILILVQSRGALFHEILRALRKEKLPTPGADRLAVSGHIAVMDLLALCDVLLNPADSLALATVLRSPLFDLGEDDLLAIAAPRDERETLWQALAASSLPVARPAYQRLARWRAELDFERPFAFLTQVLYAEGGLRRFHARLGSEVDDVLAELLDLALAHEQDRQPSLQGFVAAMRQRSGSIRRELPEKGAGVRLMTVHGAKGLEAPIVILADAATKPSTRQIARSVYVLDKAPGPLLIHAAGRAGHVPATLALRQAADERRMHEYWRLLYVAMTRAEDELYVTGPLTPGTDAMTQRAGTWYEAVDTTLRPHARSEQGPQGEERALVFPAHAVPPVPATGSTAVGIAPARPLDLTPIPAPVRPSVITPSTAHRAGISLASLDRAVETLRDAASARKEGIALHALLQYLPGIDEAAWPAVLPRAMATLLPDAVDRHDVLAAKAMSILRRPELAPLFGPGSRGEVPFLADMLRHGEPVRIAGRFDRLVVDESGVMVVDYKSDASVPGGPGDMPGNYFTQLGLYALVASQLFPGRKVRAAILWTELESLMNLPPDDLAEGSKGFTMR